MKKAHSHLIDSHQRKRLAVDLQQSEYSQIHQLQLNTVEAIHSGQLDRDIVFVLEHHPVYTIGRNGNREHLLAVGTERAADRIPVVRIERGGEITFHGPGQLVGYPIIDLKSAGLSVKAYVAKLEEVMLCTADDFGVIAHRRAVNPGVWVGRKKLGSVGVAVRRGVSFHGFAININIDLTPFLRINPCGMAGIEMTSLEKELGHPVSLTIARQRIWYHLGKQLYCDWNRASLTDLALVDPPLEIQSSGKPDNRKTSQPKNRKIGKPRWLRQRLPSGPQHERIRNLIHDKGLRTVCQQARCPNQFECFSEQTATFLILGDRCTRNCGFCNVAHGPHQPPDPDEPGKVALAAKQMKLGYVVITSVTRDDLSDGGAEHFAKTIHAVRNAIDRVQIEVLIPDFQGNETSLHTVLTAQPDVLNHNIETVARLYPLVRPQADYDQSLALLKRVSNHELKIPAKSGLMLGLGETEAEIKQCLKDILTTGCKILTLGQYLQPSRKHLPVSRYISPESFDTWKQTAIQMGFVKVASGPFVRSSYHAKDLYSDHIEK